jgi:hypothetical protein
LKNALAYYNAGVAAVNSKDVKWANTVVNQKEWSESGLEAEKKIIYIDTVNQIIHAMFVIHMPRNV